MKITTTDSSTPKVRPYPKLMISTNLKQVVFMDQHGCGVVLHNGKSATTAGRYSASWPIATFEDYEGTITLENDNV